jgi:hypothetical protein
MKFTTNSKNMSGQHNKVTFEVLTAASMKVVVFRAMWKLTDNRRGKHLRNVG